MKESECGQGKRTFVLCSDYRLILLPQLSRYQMAFLNRQFFILLSTLGIPTMSSQTCSARRCGGAEIWRVGPTRASCLKTTSPSPLRRRWCVAPEPTMNMQTDVSPGQQFPLRKALPAGLAKDPMVQDVLQAVERKIFPDLRWNAHVEVEQGAYLMGIADEMGVLEEGEVFCQIVPPGGEPQVMTGLCVVRRAPALHSGAIRRVQAVDCPELRCMENVIIFSTRGDRDLPSMLGSGNLDGDDFTLIWDPDMTGIEQHPPAEFPTQTPARVPWVTQEDI